MSFRYANIVVIFLVVSNRFNAQSNSGDTSTSVSPRTIKNIFSLPSAARVIKATRNEVLLRKFKETYDANTISTQNHQSSQNSQTTNDEMSVEKYIIRPDSSKTEESKTEAAPTEGQPEAALETMRHHIEELNLPAVAIDALKQDDLIAFRVIQTIPFSF